MSRMALAIPRGLTRSRMASTRGTAWPHWASALHPAFDHPASDRPAWPQTRGHPLATARIVAPKRDALGPSDILGKISKCIASKVLLGVQRAVFCHDSYCNKLACCRSFKDMLPEITSGLYRSTNVQRSMKPLLRVPYCLVAGTRVSGHNFHTIYCIYSVYWFLLLCIIYISDILHASRLFQKLQHIYALRKCIYWCSGYFSG